MCNLIVPIIALFFGAYHALVIVEVWAFLFSNGEDEFIVYKLLFRLWLRNHGAVCFVVFPLLINVPRRLGLVPFPMGTVGTTTGLSLRERISLNDDVLDRLVVVIFGMHEKVRLIGCGDCRSL